MQLPLAAPPPAELHTYLEPALQPGDELIWCGQPRGIGGHWVLHFQAIVCATLLALLIASVIADRTFSIGLAAWLVPLGVLVLATALLYGLFVAALVARRNRTVYGLTRDAAIIYEGWPWRRIRLVDLSRVAYIGLELGARDGGTIRFGQAGAPWPNPAPPAFERIRHARRVFDLARGARSPVAGRLNFGEQKSEPELPEG